MGSCIVVSDVCSYMNMSGLLFSCNKDRPTGVDQVVSFASGAATGCRMFKLKVPDTMG